MEEAKSDKIFFIGIFVAAVVVYLVSDSSILRENRVTNNVDSTISPIVDQERRINDKGQVVYKEIVAHLYNLDENYDYNFISRINDNPNTYKIAYDQNAIMSCIDQKCNYIYFSKSNSIALFTDLNNPVFGKVVDFEILKGDGEYNKEKGCARGSKIIYYLDYGAKDLHKITEDLSASYQGGDFGCLSKNYQVGDEVVFFIDGLTGVFKKSDIYKAELLDYRFSDFPDTGVKYELIEFK